MRTVFVAAAVLYALVAILLAASLPGQVPLTFGTDLTAHRWATRGELMFLVCTLGALIIGVFAALSAQVSRLSGHLQQFGAVTLVFLAVQLAVVYGGSTGAVPVGLPSSESEAAFAAAAQAAVRLSPWTLLLLVAYLAYVLVWLAWVVTGRPSADPRPRQNRMSRGTADSAA